MNTQLTKEQLENLIVTALEGGSNYWYQLGKMPEDLPLLGEPLAVRITEYVWNGGTISIYDIENSDGEDESEWEKLGDLSIGKVNDGMTLCAASHQHCIDNLCSEDYDADDADVLFQFCVMGELVFG